MGKDIRDSSGRRLRSSAEFVETCKRDGHPVTKVKIYNKSEDKVMEGFKNLVTGRTAWNLIRRASFEEKLKYDTVLFQKGKSPMTGKPYDQLSFEIDDNGNEKIAIKTKESLKKMLQ